MPMGSMVKQLPYQMQVAVVHTVEETDGSSHTVGYKRCSISMI